MQIKLSACTKAQRQSCTGTVGSATDTVPSSPDGIRLDLTSSCTRWSHSHEHFDKLCSSWCKEVVGFVWRVSGLRVKTLRACKPAIAVGKRLEQLSSANIQTSEFSLKAMVTMFAFRNGPLAPLLTPCRFPSSCTWNWGRRAATLW